MEVKRNKAANGKAITFLVDPALVGAGVGQLSSKTSKRWTRSVCQGIIHSLLLVAGKSLELAIA